MISIEYPTKLIAEDWNDYVTAEIVGFIEYAMHKYKEYGVIDVFSPHCEKTGMKTNMKLVFDTEENKILFILKYL